ncbi:uncharacterized protein LOC111894739 isoform X5 [Lactuca sativa]|uniref:uncharacterized protein LOC111894739 isoform X5 n=1 Tax=Lactuca sativa TaxID=4236 RepID=UPI000CD7FDD9|nr:uncharacterized protein LOC111894739 isoform X5 [Lactuca sativa]
MAASQREQALSLLAAANNHGDLAVKLSSLKQAKDILLSADLSLLSDELFPYLVELQSCHEALVRKTLVEVVEEISLKAMEYSQLLMQVLLTLLTDPDSVVARQAIVAGTHIFCEVLDALAFQFHRHGIVERWLEEIWSWMIKFKDSVFQVALEARSVGPRLLAIKFLETCVLLFMPDNDSRGHATEAVARSAQMFNISWLSGGHPVLDSIALQSEANRSLFILFDLLRSPSLLPGSITISIINSNVQGQSDGHGMELLMSAPASSRQFLIAYLLRGFGSIAMQFISFKLFSHSFAVYTYIHTYIQPLYCDKTSCKFNLINL